MADYQIAPVTETERHRLNGAATREPSLESAPELNGNGGLARAAMASEASKQAPAPASLYRKKKQAQAPAGFDLAISLLEARSGRPLTGPWRDEARAAFGENRRGFCRILRDLLEREGVRSHFALLMRMVRDGDHRLPDLPEMNGNRVSITSEGDIVVVPRRDEDVDLTESTPEPCPSCGTGGGQHVADCEAVAKQREQSLEAMRKSVADSSTLRSPEPNGTGGAKP